jgi:hypothetical protein
MAENIVFNIRNEGPLASSSPVPPNSVNSKIPIRSIPPPVAPKPKIIPEKMDFTNKLRNFESMIAGNSNVSNIPSKLKGPLPAKKSLISEADILKLKEDESRRQKIGNQINYNEASPSDPNYEHLLTNRFDL